MGTCPDVDCKTGLEHRVTSLESVSESFSRDLGEVKDSVKKMAENMLQIKWAAIGMTGWYIASQIGITELLKKAIPLAIAG